MERISKMWRSALAMVLAICMVLSFCPVAAFAANEINYVSIGDSMTNGYGFEGYNQDEHTIGYDFFGDSGVYGNGAYPNTFATYLEGQGYVVNHTKLALSGLRAENMLYLLGMSDEMSADRYDVFYGYAGRPDKTTLRNYYQDAVKDADVISLALGNASFNAYLIDRMMRVFGAMGGGFSDADPEMSLSDALAMLDGETEKKLVQTAYNTLKSELKNAIPAAMLEQFQIERLCDLVAYITASFAISYKDVIEWIGENNDDAEVILVGVLNSNAGMTISGPGFNFDLGSAMDKVYGAVNAYIAALPTVLQATGKYENVKFYYVKQPSNPKMIAAMVDDLAAAEWGVVDRVDGPTVQVKTRDAYKEIVAPMVEPMVKNMLREQIADEAIYNAMIGDVLNLANTIVYGGLEVAIVESLQSGEIKLDAIATFVSEEGLAAVFSDAPGSAIGAAVADPTKVQDAIDAFAEFFSSETMLPLVRLFAMNKVGNGISAHPTPATHDDIASAVIYAYKHGHTAKDETVENVNYVLGELKNFLEKYGPEAADMAYEMWVKYGYEQIVNDCIAELTAMVDARYTNYIENVLPALNDAIVALNGQKDALNTELVTLKTQLDEKKAELLKVLAEQEITEITPPEFDIETELGNNEQTQVPENDCAGTGNVADELQAAIADLEHAIAVVEALIADVTADIEDMVALATEIAEGVATLEQTLTDIAAAAQDLKGAVDAVVAVLTDDSAKAASKTFMKAFNAARDAALIAVDTVEMLVETVNGDVATIEASLATLEEYANKLADNFDATKGNILGEVMDAIPEDAMMIIGGSVMLVQQTLEENKEAIIAALNTQKDALLSELNTQKDAILLDLNNEKDAILKDLGEKKDALAEEYGPQIDEALLQLNAKKDEINNEIQTKYAELQANAQEQIDNLQKDAQVKLDALNLELQGYMAQLAGDISDELRAEIQPQIDRINNDIATINADLACAIEHVNAELQEAYDNLVEEVNNIYNDVMTELQNAYDTLVDAYNTAVKQLQDAADEAIKALQDAADEAIKQLQDAYDEAVKQLQDAADKAIQDLVDAAQKELDKLGEIGDMLSDILDGVLQAIHGDISAAQQAIANVLAGIQGSVSELADALIDLGVDSVNALVDEVTKVINDMLHKATHADLELYGDSIYVALGDGTAVAEGYAEKVGEQLKAEYGVSTTINYAEAGNTVGAELTKVAGRDGIADADLITIGFGNTTILENAVRKAGRVDYDWAELVGEDLVPYVEDALAEAYAEVAKAGMDAEMTAYANAMIEGFAYGAVEYAVELPALIAAIREVNADAVIVVVGQYNPMSGVVLELDGATLDLSEYIDYFVDAVAVHGIGYAMITGDAIFVEAPEVTTSNTDMSWNMIDLAMMIANPEGFEVLNPNEAGEVYIANQILEALNISQIGLWGDADGDGIVNLRDAMLILKAANNHEVSINRKLSDVTGDGDVNLADAMWVLKRANKHSDLFPVEK